jgi:hypothetical protein
MMIDLKDVPHCSDGSDELPHRLCSSRTFHSLLIFDRNKFVIEIDFEDLGKSWTSDTTTRPVTFRRHQWRGIVITAFVILIFIVFLLFTIYFICRRCLFRPAMPLINGERKNYATIVNSRMSHVMQSMLFIL